MDGKRFFELCGELDALPSDKHEAFIDSVEDEALRSELRRYAFPTTDRIIPGNVWDKFTSIEQVFSPDQPPINGRYHVLDRIGDGGMGVVFLAEDLQVSRRRVALKVLAPGMSTLPDRERDVMIKIEHPNVVSLIDVGHTTDPRFEFLVLTYVKGVPIAAYCREQNPSLDERIELFKGVCRGVSAAHVEDVAHRDISHNNVLVDSDATPMVIDFGIAKEMQSASSSHERPTTAHLPRTRGYASPERLIEGKTGRADDIYALGVLLCVLVTGRQPFHAETDGALIVETTQSEPKRPSTLLAGEPLSGETSYCTPPPGDLKSLQRRYTPDLDAIVQKALARDPAHRYASPLLFAEDLEAFLAYQPVQAHTASLAQRIWRLCRRHPLGSFSTAASLLTIIALVVSVVLASRQAQIQKDTALREARLQRETTQYLKELFQNADPWQTATATTSARDMLDRAADSAVASLSASPESAASFLTTLADINRNLGNYEKAAGLALRGLRTLAEDRPDATTLILGLRRQYALAERSLGNIESALREHEATEALLMADPSSASPREVVEARLEHAQTLFHTNDLERTERGYRAVIKQATSLNDAAPRLLAAAEAGLAELLATKNVWEDAEQLYRGSLSRLQDQDTSHPLTIQVMSGLAELLDLTDRSEEAEETLLTALARSRSRFGDDHPLVASLLSDLGVVYFYQERHQPAEAAYREALALRVKFLGGDHVDVAQVEQNLALLLEDQGKVEEAEMLLRRALQTREANLGPRHRDVASTASNLANLQRERGILEEALTLQRQVLEIETDIYGRNHSYVATDLNNLASTLIDLGRRDEALPLLNEAASIAHDVVGDDHYLYALVIRNRARVKLDKGHVDEAIADLLVSISILESDFGSGHSRVLIAQSYLATALVAKGAHDEAESLFLTVIDGLKSAERVRPWHLRFSYEGLANLYEKLGRHDRAKDARQSLAAINEQ